jgi:preprotein translocase subunit SecD
MLEYARWKFVVMALVLLASAFYALPNLYPSDPSVQIAALKSAPVDAALSSRVQDLLKAKGIGYKSIAIEGKGLLVRLNDSDSQTAASDQIRPALGKEYSVAINLAPNVPSWLTAIGSKPMSLGLDLQGGVHFLLEVDQKAAREKAENAFVDSIRSAMRERKLRYSDVSREPGGIRVVLAKADDRGAALNLLAQQVPELAFGEAPDSEDKVLRGTLSEQRVQEIATKAIEQNVIVLRNRINGLGVAEPIIQRQGSNRIVVQLPGLQDMTQARNALGGTATLEFRAVVEGDAAAALRDGTVPPEARVYSDTVYGFPIMLSKRLLVSGEELVDAIPQIDQQSGQPSVSIKLNSAGGNRMFKHTLDNVGKRMGIVYIERSSYTSLVDGKEVRTTNISERVISASTIQGVFGKDFQTTGLSQQEATDLARQLKAGALAAPVDIVAQRVIGPTLGAENVRRGVQAVLFSFAFVMVFFVVYYKLFGIVTNMALLLNLLLVVAVMSLLGATLTLPGFAGIALTVGMSVDANVLINERIREELRAGNTPLASIAAGYDKASGTIADANVTALLGGVAMAAFGTGPIRGFGITLIIGILTSMYTAVSVSRGVATLIYGRKRKLAKISI